MGILKSSRMSGEGSPKEDPLSRIVREISEVTEREREFKEGHFRKTVRNNSESSIEVNKQNGQMNGDSLSNSPMNRAVSTSHLLDPVGPIISGLPVPVRRVTSQTTTKGIMQRFIANKGKLPATAPMNAQSQPLPQSFAFLPPVMQTAARDPSAKPVRKGYVPVEEKIQKELQEMKHREHELKRMRKKRKPFELALVDYESSSESEDEGLPIPGKIYEHLINGTKNAKSIEKLYDCMRSPLSGPSCEQGSLGSLKKAQSLAQLCELAPGEQFLAPSTTLIAKWESLIQQKKKGDHGSSSDFEDDEEIPLPNKLKNADSIEKFYECMRSSPSRPRSRQGSLGSLKPPKSPTSLANLCELAPGEQFLAPSSTSLIAKWESIIQNKQKAGAVHTGK